MNAGDSTRRHASARRGEHDEEPALLRCRFRPRRKTRPGPHVPGREALVNARAVVAAVGAACKVTSIPPSRERDEPVQRRRVGERHPVVGLHASIDEPVPVVGGLHHHACEGCLVRGSGLHNRRQMRGQSFLVDQLSLVMESHDHTVVCMQINTAV